MHDINENPAVIEMWEIPRIELYMDQVTTFMEDKLSFYKRYEDEKILTKTMINNYAKERLFPAPVKKKYNKNHMMLLIIIYHLKSVVSISDIKRLLMPVNEALSEGDSSCLENVYENFVMMQKALEEKSMEEIKGEISKNDENTMADKILNVLLYALYSENARIKAEKLIDEAF